MQVYTSVCAVCIGFRIITNKCAVMTHCCINKTALVMKTAAIYCTILL